MRDGRACASIASKCSRGSHEPQRSAGRRPGAPSEGVEVSDDAVRAGLPPGYVRPIRVAILVNSGVMRRGCAAIVDAAPHLELAHQGPSADDDALRGVQADFVVVGMSTRRDDGARMVSRLARRGECVIAVTAPGVRAAVALELGAHACIEALEPDDTALLRAIAQIVRGDAPARPAAASRGLATISPREEDVLRELASGCTDREIAVTLGISVRTVQSHLDRIREKTQRRRRAELTVLAFELGIAPGAGRPARDAR
jgi:DNA-binding NarL/FixJ family response regulator